MPPVPPPIPGGFTDAQGTLGFFANNKGGIDAVDLSTGDIRWTSQQGRWPLFTRYGWLAVGGADKTQKGVLRVRFLDPQDGKLLSESGPITIGGIMESPDAVSNETGVSYGDRNGFSSIAAWCPSPQRSAKKDAWAGLLQLRLQSQAVRTLGIQPREPAAKPVIRTLLIDPTNGKMKEATGKLPPFGLTDPKMPKGWKKKPNSIYWSWSPYGSAWTDKPRPFPIAGGAGMSGYFSCDYQAKCVLLNRWRGGKAMAPVTLVQGTEHVPIVTLDDRYVVVTSYYKDLNHGEFFDLLSGKKAGPLDELPWFEEGFKLPPAVIGSLFYYVTEKRGKEGGMDKTEIERRLIALDWEKGKIRWTYKLASRFEYPPVAGGGMPR